jgi:alpha-glucoside transport system substrate-binding protein
MSKKSLWIIALVLTVIVAACAPPAPEPTEEPATEEPTEPARDCMGAEGSTVTMIGVWSGDEEADFKAILEPFLTDCNVTLEYEGTRDQAILATRVEGGNPPDIAGLPNPGIMGQYADSLIAIGDVIDLDDYSPAWQSLGSVAGTVYGAFFKADTKSLVWYNPMAFEAAGYEVPTSWDDLLALSDQIVADGGTPWSTGIESGEATGWVATDWLQDILLRTKGPDFVEQWVRHEVPWTDPAIVAAWEAYFDIAASDTYALGGADGTINTAFAESLYPLYLDPPAAYLCRMAGFAGGVVAEQYPDLEEITDYDFFVLPEANAEMGAPMQGGADIFVMFNDSPGAKGLMAYMFSAEAGEALAASGWGLSPNSAVAASAYPSALSGKMATALTEAPSFSFDADDRMPGGINVDYFAAVTEYLGGGDLTGILERLERKAFDVYGETPPEPTMADYCEMAQGGGTVTMIGVWSGDEEADFKAILEPFLTQCNVTLEYEGTRDQAILATRVEGGNPPDIAGLPNPGIMGQYVDSLLPVGPMIDIYDYSPAWQSLGSVAGTVYGAFFKADTKSLVWYNPMAFEAAGYEVPASWDDLLALSDQIVADGGTPWSTGIESGDATGWVATDWVQDILLRTKGPDFVEQWVRHEVPWTDPDVAAAWEAYFDIAASDTYALGGADGTINTDFAESLYPLYLDPPEAYLCRMAGFAGGTIAAQYPDLEEVTGYDFFVLPEANADLGAPMQGGADIFVAFSDAAPAKALMAYMFGPYAGRDLAASGWGLSPNNRVKADAYPSALSGKMAMALTEAPSFSFDADDRMPGGINVDYFAAVTEYLGGGDLTTILERMEAKAEEVY